MLLAPSPVSTSVIVPGVLLVTRRQSIRGPTTWSYSYRPPHCFKVHEWLHFNLCYDIRMFHCWLNISDNHSSIVLLVDSSRSENNKSCTDSDQHSAHSLIRYFRYLLIQPQSEYSFRLVPLDWFCRWVWFSHPRLLTGTRRCIISCFCQ